MTDLRGSSTLPSATADLAPPGKKRARAAGSFGLRSGDAELYLTYPCCRVQS